MEYDHMKKLTNTQKQHLRSLANDLRPAVQIGKNGLTDQIHTTIEHELNAHELIKIKFMDFKAEKRQLTEELAAASNGTLIGLIGNVAILYREQSDPEKRQIKLPN
jgi:RNA-binding protein